MSRRFDILLKISLALGLLLTLTCCAAPFASDPHASVTPAAQATTAPTPSPAPTATAMSAPVSDLSLLPTATVLPTPTDDGLTAQQRQLLARLPSLGPAPELENEVWLNSEPLRLAELRGKVVLIDMWTYG